MTCTIYILAPDRADSEKARADKIEAQKQSMLLEIERLKRLLEKGQE